MKETHKKLETAKALSIAALILTCLMYAALILTVVLCKVDCSPSVFKAVTTAIVFMWLIVSAVVIAFCIAGIALSVSAGKNGEPGTKPVKRLCIILLVAVCVGGIAYAVVYGVLVGA